MEIKYRNYPYPVLSEFSDDFTDSAFIVGLSPQKEGFDLKLAFKAEIKNEGLNRYLKEGAVNIVYHLECPQTTYRKAIKTTNAQIEYLISEKQLNGKLQICSFLVAARDIPNYKNNFFHEDYDTQEFFIENGSVLAVGKSFFLDIEKEVNDLVKTPSVISIIKNINHKEKEMLVDMDEARIVIKLPEKEYYNYKTLDAEISMHPVLHSMVIVPALLFVLEEIKRKTPEDRTEYDHYRWYRAIKKALIINFNIDIESDAFTEKNMFEMAQKIINTPISEALNILTTVHDNHEDAEDE